MAKSELDIELELGRELLSSLSPEDAELLAMRQDLQRMQDWQDRRKAVADWSTGLAMADASVLAPTTEQRVEEQGAARSTALIAGAMKRGSAAASEAQFKADSRSAKTTKAESVADSPMVGEPVESGPEPSQAIRYSPDAITELSTARDLLQKRPDIALKLLQSVTPSRADVAPIIKRGSKLPSEAERQQLADNIGAAMYEQEMGGSAGEYFDQKLVDQVHERLAVAKAEKARNTDPRRREALLQRFRESAVMYAATTDPKFAELKPEEQLARVNEDRKAAGLESIEALPGPQGMADYLKKAWLTEEGLADRAPVLGAIYSTAQLMRIRDAAARFESGTETLDDWETMAQAQEKMLADAQGKTAWGQIASVVTESATFAAEFAAGGVVSGGAKSAAKVAGRKAIETSMAKVMTRILGKVSERLLEAAPRAMGAAAKVGEIGVEAALRMPAMGATVAEQTVERMTPMQLMTPADDGELKAFTLREADNFREALAKSGLDTYIEVGSEMTGGALLKLVPKGVLQGVQRKLAIEWMGKNNAGWQAFQKVFEQVGYHGIIGEIGEERVGDILRLATGLTVDDEGNPFTMGAIENAIPSWRQMLIIEPVAFGLPLVSQYGAAAIFEAVHRGLDASRVRAAIRDSIRASNPDVDEKTLELFTGFQADYVNKWTKVAEKIAETGFNKQRYTIRPSPKGENVGFYVFDQSDEAPVPYMNGAEGPIDWDSAVSRAYGLNLEDALSEDHKTMVRGIDEILRENAADAVATEDDEVVAATVSEEEAPTPGSAVEPEPSGPTPEPVSEPGAGVAPQPPAPAPATPPTAIAPPPPVAPSPTEEDDSPLGKIKKLLEGGKKATAEEPPKEKQEAEATPPAPKPATRTVTRKKTWEEMTREEQRKSLITGTIPTVSEEVAIEEPRLPARETMVNAPSEAQQAMLADERERIIGDAVADLSAPSPLATPSVLREYELRIREIDRDLAHRGVDVSALASVRAALSDRGIPIPTSKGVASEEQSVRTGVGGGTEAAGAQDAGAGAVPGAAGVVAGAGGGPDSGAGGGPVAEPPVAGGDAGAATGAAAAGDAGTGGTAPAQDPGQGQQAGVGGVDRPAARGAFGPETHRIVGRLERLISATSKARVSGRRRPASGSLDAEAPRDDKLDAQLSEAVADLILDQMGGGVATHADLVSKMVAYLGRDQVAQVAAIVDRQWDNISRAMSERFQPRSQDTLLAISSHAMSEEAKARGITNRVAQRYTEYRKRGYDWQGWAPHPAYFEETRSLADVDPPMVDVEHHLPPYLRDDGLLSDIGVEGVLRAQAAHEVLLPNGSRRGFILGDGTGAGKTRQIVGMIMNNWYAGHRRHLVVTANTGLIDGLREAMAQMKFQAPLHVLGERKVGADVTGDGIVVASYKLITMDSGSRSRFDQIAKWMGPKFEGVMVFDESHMIKNLGAINENTRKPTGDGSRRAFEAWRLQNAAPLARVVYSSATFASNADHLGAYERIGLWGYDGAPFATSVEFSEALGEMEISGLEQLARDMRQLGTYVSRVISYRGVKYEPLPVEGGAEAKSAVDAMGDFWARAMEVQVQAARLRQKIEDPGGFAAGLDPQWEVGDYYARQQRFSLSITMGLKMPTILAAAEKDLADGKQVIISLMNTGDAELQREYARWMAEGQDEDIDLSPREQLRQLIDRIAEVAVDKNTGAEVPIPKIAELKAGLLAFAEQLSMPENPLDQIINHWGADQVAEITSRTHRFDPVRNMKVPRNPPGVSQSRLKTWEQEQFQKGRKRVAVISSAGGVGINLHDSRENPVQAQRVMYLAQAYWSADAQLQVLGRPHRSNQSTEPIIRMAKLDLATEARLHHAISVRLASLGASVSGDRAGLAEDLFETDDMLGRNGAAAMALTLKQIASGEHFDRGIDADDLVAVGMASSGTKRAIPRFGANPEKALNRIMAFGWDKQNAFYEIWVANYTAIVEGLKGRGEWDFGLQDLEASNVVEKAAPKEIAEDAVTGAKTWFVTLEGTVQKPKMTLADALQRGQAGLGFAVNTNQKSININHVFVVQPPFNAAERSTHRRLVDIRGVAHKIGVEDFRRKFKVIDQKTFEVAFKNQWDSTPSEGRETFYLVSGLILPQWRRIVGTLGTADGLRRIDTVRTTLADGRNVMGLRVAKSDLPGLRKRLGLTDVILEDVSAARLLQMMAGEGAVARLQNGWEMSLASMIGMDVIQLRQGEGTPIADTTAIQLGWSVDSFRGKTVFIQPVVDSEAAIAATLKRFPLAGAESGAPKPPAGGGGGGRAPDEGGGGADRAAQGHALNRIRFGTEGLVEARPIGYWELVRRLEEIWGADIRSGRLPSRVLGRFQYLRTFNPHIRIQRGDENDIGTIAHEVAHRIDATYGASFEAMPPNVEAQLRSLDYDPGKKRAFEGFAEFIRLLTTADNEAENRAPDFFRWWWDEYLATRPDLHSQILEMVDLFDRYRLSSARDVAARDIVREGKIPAAADQSMYSRLLQHVRRTWDRSLYRVQDSAIFTKRMVEDARSQGVALPLSSDPYVMQSLLVSRAKGYAEQALSTGVRTLRNPGAIIGPGLKEVLEIIPANQMDDFEIFLWARQGMEMWRLGMNPGMSKSRTYHLFRNLSRGKPHFRRAAKGVTKFANNVLSMMRDSGVITAGEYEAMVERWKRFIPMKRGKRGATKDRATGSRILQVHTGVERRRGSGFPIISPLESLIIDTTRHYQRAAHQEVINAIFRTVARVDAEKMEFSDEAEFQSMSRGKLWAAIVPSRVKQTKFSGAEIWEQLKEIIGSYVSREELQSAKAEIQAAMLSIYRPNHRSEPGKFIAEVIHAGERRQLMMDPDLFEALNTAEPTTLPWAADLLFGAPSRMVKLGATGINVTFGAKNLANDMVAFWAGHGARLTKGMSAKEIGETLLHNVRPMDAIAVYVASHASGVFGGPKDPQVELYDALGVNFARLLGADQRSVTRMRHLLTGRSAAAQALDVARHPLETASAVADLLRNVVGISEVGPRFAEFRRVLNENGYTSGVIKEGAAVPLEVLLEAIRASMEVTVNFSRHGTWYRYLETVPYTNAAIQSLDRFVRVIRDNPTRAFIMGSVYAAARIAWWIKHHDDDWYKGAPPWQKYGMWVFTNAEGRPVLRLPMGQNFGWVYGAGVQAILDAYVAKGIDPLADGGREAVASMLPFGDAVRADNIASFVGAFLPVLPDLGIALAANRDHFGRPIVKESQLKGPSSVEPRDQYHEYTTRLCRLMGDYANQSPAKMEFLLNSMSGGLYRNVVANGEHLLRFSPWRTRDLPVVGGFTFSRDYSTAVGDLHKQYAELEAKIGSIELRKEPVPIELTLELRRMDRAKELVGSIGKLLKDEIDPEVRFTMGERYAVGAARDALGLEPLKSYPLPHTDPNIPDLIARDVEDQLSSLYRFLAQPDIDEAVERRRRSKFENGQQIYTESAKAWHKRLEGLQDRIRTRQVQIRDAEETLARWGLWGDRELAGKHLSRMNQQSSQPVHPDTMRKYARRIDLRFAGKRVRPEK